MSRCIADTLRDGGAEDEKQAAAICYAKWRERHKAQPNTVRNLIESKIHRAYTVACDELLMRGYLTRDERLAIGGLIGDLLMAFGEKLDPSLTDRLVLPEDVEALAAQKDAGALTVFKQADGRYRWVALSSSAYRDRDREIVSTRALADAVAANDAAGSHGPLRWWHEPGADLGACDYSALHDRVLVESGTFDDDAVGEALKDAAEALEMSLGFHYPAHEPDGEGVFHTIRIFERSLVPRGRASNLLTAFAVAAKEAQMEPEKKSLLQKLLGPELAGRILGRAEKAQAEAAAAGVAFKGDDEEKKPEGEAPPAAPAEAPPEEAPAEAAPAEAQPRRLGDMTEDELKAYVAKCMEPYAAQMEEMKGMLGARKEASDAAAAESATALKALADGQAELRRGFQALGAAVADLTGDLPRAQRRGYRPDQDPTTVADEARQKELGKPAADPKNQFSEFTQWAVGGNGAGPKS